MGSLKLRPGVLQHPNIPKPLHGISPRAVMGQAWWDTARKAVYTKQGDHCIACGVHKSKAKYHNWIEAHEDYTIDYQRGTMEIRDIVGLCHSCHNFIHCGRLGVLLKKGEVSKSKWKEIMLHGFRILKQSNLDPWYGQCFAYMDGLEYIGEEVDHILYSKACNLQAQQEEPMQQDWTKWHMVFEGKKYYSKFKNIEEWQREYSR